MHVQIDGPTGAPTVMLLHAMGTSGWMWEPVVERLGTYRCLVPDLPGHGRSAATSWDSLDRTVDELAALIAREATGGQAHIVGLSMGAYVGLRLMARAPGRVDRAVLSGLNVLPYPAPRLMRLAGRLMAPLMGTEFVLKGQARALRVPPERVAGFMQAAKAMSRDAFLRIGGELMDFRVTSDMEHARSPCLVVAGEREHDLIRRSIPAVLRVLPNARGALVPGLGHGWSGEDPDLFASTVQAWCEAGELPPGVLRVAAG